MEFSWGEFLGPTVLQIHLFLLLGLSLWVHTCAPPRRLLRKRTANTLYWLYNLANLLFPPAAVGEISWFWGLGGPKSYFEVPSFPKCTLHTPWDLGQTLVCLQDQLQKKYNVSQIGLIFGISTCLASIWRGSELSSGTEARDRLSSTIRQSHKKRDCQGPLLDKVTCPQRWVISCVWSHDHTRDHFIPVPHGHNIIFRGPPLGKAFTQP